MNPPSCPQHLEKTGDLKEALKHYELSGCAHIEVPRMYYDTQQIGELEKYVASKVKSDRVVRLDNLRSDGRDFRGNGLLQSMMIF